MNERLNNPRNTEGQTSKEELDSIDTSTEQGKLEWLNTFMVNLDFRKKEKLKTSTDDHEKKELKEALKQIDYSQKILYNVEPNGEGGVVGSLFRELKAARENEDKLRKNGATQETLDNAFRRTEAASNLIYLIQGEMSRRKIDIMPTIDKLESEIDKREESLEYIKEHNQDHDDYNYKIDMAAGNLSKCKKDLNLLNRIVEKNGYNSVMSIDDVKPILKKEIEARNKRLATINETLKNEEKGSENWKKTIQNRRQVYNLVSDESVERILRNAFNVPDESMKQVLESIGISVEEEED